MRSWIWLVVFLWGTSCSQAQNLSYARSVVDTLCSPFFAGRGYLKGGDEKAADYIREQFSNFGLKSFGASYYQNFGFPVNVFPTNPEVYIDGVELQAGSDFIVDPASRSVNGTFELRWVDSATIDDNGLFKVFEEKTHFHRTFLVLDRLHHINVKQKGRLKRILNNEYRSYGVIEIRDKLMWSVATAPELHPKIQVRSGLINYLSRLIRIDVFSQVNNHQTQNVIGFVKGREKPDSFIVFTAHYDHLGMMGRQVYFPGANDNASGVAMMLDLASWYATQKPRYSIAFMAFAGEEAGLLGSYYYTTHPLFPLKSIKFLVNMDLMGTGSKGITVVNATVFPDYFNKLEIANTIGSYFPNINQRGKAQNSDHYYFSEAGVPSFFIYLMGDYPWYHDIDDQAFRMHMEKYEDSFRLIRDFVKEIEGPENSGN